MPIDILQPPTPPNNAKYMQKLHSPPPICIWKEMEELCVCFSWLPLTWYNLPQALSVLNRRGNTGKKQSTQARWEAPAEWQKDNDTSFTDPSCPLFQKRPPSFAFLQEMSWAAWASAWLAMGHEPQFSMGHPLCIQTPRSPWGEASSRLLQQGRNT